MPIPCKLPSAIARFIGSNSLVADEVGESPADVYGFTRGNDRFFLKTCTALYAPTTYSVLREARVLQWLDGRLKVPEVAVVAESEAGEFMITRSVPGVPLQAHGGSQGSMVALLREALRQLQAVAIADCPFDSGVAVRLDELQYLIAHDLCADDVDLEQWPDLPTPEKLLAHLQTTRPIEDKVFSHGDLCDSNVFVDAHDQLHFIDLGRGGIADRWLDIAFAHRNLREDVSPVAAAQLLQALGEPDASAKRLFFEQLDELF
ncbi:aminoglycoside 3'-phosphotransferase [Pseudomonas chlororaphis]|uniref:APH(3') family aminoglycoside O-phosphotransferase n=1 Tax=Pseudomonas chlororaphis TaxID=587753 RepID=UPI001E64F02A|nr:APH(3') family aminoglycoside O-phosphotransferase [Pseudomonas chlororaphis]MCB2255045.1 aminoglycoside 3'-phosphotransferase [Pseudomonas chlororaphis]